MKLKFLAKKNAVKEVKTDEHKSSFFMSVLKGSLMALSVSLICVLIFAFILRFVDGMEGAIKPINQVIKTISIIIGCIYGLKKTKEMGLITGLVIGLMYTILAFVVFSILDNNFEFSRVLINDLLFGGIIGAIAGIIAVNFGKKSR